MRLDCVEKRLATAFAAYARLVTRWPAPFILVPLLLTCVLLLGIAKRPPLLKDDLSLYTPNDAEALKELKSLSSLFPINDSDPYFFDRRYDSNRAGYVLVTTKHEEGNVMAPEVLEEVVELWENIAALTVIESPLRSFNYSQLCINLLTNWPKPRSACIQNPIVQTFNLSPESVAGLQYPISQFGWYVSRFLGGVTVDNSKLVVGAKSILLPYQLRYSSPIYDDLAEKWELALSDFLSEFWSPTLEVSWWTSETLPSEAARDRSLLLHLLVPLFVAVTLFTIGCCFVGSWVRSRPWLGLGGVISAALAVLSAIGALLLAGHQFTSVAFCMPFIVLSIGVDNVFILLAAWRKTNASLCYSERMGLTWRDAGVSITVTSLTDALSFGIGCITTFPSVRIFCLYAATAILFVYLYQLTFFAGIMAITGRREVAGRHCLTFQKTQRSITMHRPNDPKYWHNEIGNHKPKNSIPEENLSYEKNHALARFFRNSYTSFLLNPFVRFLIILVFLAYFGVACWGCTRIKLGLEPIDLLPGDSYGRRTLSLYERYYQENGAYLHVWIRNLSTLDGDRRLWVPLKREMEKFEHTEFTGYSDSWLRVFLAFVRAAGLLLTPDNFVYILRNIFLKTPQYQIYGRDLVFDASGAKLEAIRFPVHLRFVGMRNQSRAMTFFRRLADSSSMDVDVYSDFFRFAEQYDAVLPGTLINVGLAGAAVILVSLILIPQPLCALWVSLTIVSINVGILGYMSLWDVRLDFVSMVTIVMSIGFCVDFSAHLAYHFAKERAQKSADRLRSALYAVGTPILQSAASTILGVVFLVVVDSYVFRSFLKTVVLVIILGAFHGLVVLPVLLTLFFCGDKGAVSWQEEPTTGGERSSPSGASQSSQDRPTPKLKRAQLNEYSTPTVSRHVDFMPYAGSEEPQYSLPRLVPHECLPPPVPLFGPPLRFPPDVSKSQPFLYAAEVHYPYR